VSAHYDAVIVGGGVMGALVARVLSQAGKSVLILEAGIEGAMNPDTYRQYLQTLYTEGWWRGLPNGPYPWNASAPSPGIPSPPNGAAYPYYQYATNVHFLSDYLRMLGGTTLHWQGTSMRLVPNDFRMRSAYGHAENWPITYDDLEPAYRRAEAELGVSADVEDQRIFGVWFPEGYVYPMHRMPPSRVDQFFDGALQGKTVKLSGGSYPLRVISIPVARNSTPNPKYDLGEGYDAVPAVSDRDQGQRCQGNSVCMPICPVQAKYTALKTIAALARTPTVDIRTQAVASKLLIDKETGRITGVEYKRYDKPGSTTCTLETAHGTLVVLAANAIENATLLLASNAANSSGQVGRNLMDHPYLYVWGLAKSRVFPFRGPDTTSGVESLRDGQFRTVHASFRASLSNWGWSGEPGNTIKTLLQANTYGTALREQLADQMTRMVKIGFMFEQLPSADNRVTIDPQYRDALGNYRPVLAYHYQDYSLKGIEAAVNTVWPAITGYAGIENKTSYPAGAPGYQHVVYNGAGYNLMGSGHIVGTHRMGSHRKDSVTDRNMKTWDHPNLYVVGTGNQVTIGTANPTLTGAALSIRAAEAMLQELR
jgi:choline dehydrogenase-like flavoprotein